jgi:hypothetical protein
MCSILTTQVNNDLTRPLHDRMPIIIYDLAECLERLKGES